MSDQFFWYITRSAALGAWLAAAISMLVGLLTSSRLLGRRPTIPWLVDLHRFASSVSMVFLVIHMASLWADSFVSFSWQELLIPFVATVPGLTRLSIALGVMAAWLLAIVYASSLVKDRMPIKVWRTIHLTSFGTLILGTVHAIQAGSDVSNPIVIAIGVSLLTAVTFATLGRLVRFRQETDRGPSDDAGRFITRPAETGYDLIEPEWQPEPRYEPAPGSNGFGYEPQGTRKYPAPRRPQRPRRPLPPPMR